MLTIQVIRRSSCAEGGTISSLFVIHRPSGQLRARRGGQVEAARSLCRAGIEIAERTTELHNLSMLYLTAACLARDDSERVVQLDQAEACAVRIESVASHTRIARARAVGSMQPWFK